MLNIIGLVFVSVAWAIQLYSVFKGSKEIKKSFLSFYLVGVAFLVFNGFNAGSAGSWLDLLSIILAGTILIKLLIKPKQKKRR